MHQATLHDGTPVVLKVQRPHIQNQMKADLGIMQNAARVASGRSEGLRAIDLEGMLEEFSSSVLRELDYTGEAYNALRLGESMAELPGVSVPKIYPELSTSRLLTMEYIRGVKISDVDAIDAAGIDRQTLAKNTLRALVKQLLIDGFFHADPHPGNILVNLDSAEATFIDTGMVGELELTQRVNLIQLLMTMQGNDVQGMAQVMYSLSEPFVDEVDEKAYYRDFNRTVGRYMAYGGGSGFGESVNVALGLLRDHGLRLDPQLTMAVKAMMQAEAVTTVLYPEGGIMAEGVPMVKELAVEAVTTERIVDEATKQASMAAREVLKRLPTIQEATVKWLDQYSKGRFEVTIDTSELAEEVDKLGSIGRQIVIGIILVGMLIGSAIATFVLVDNPWVFVDRELWDFMFNCRLVWRLRFLHGLIAILMVIKLVWDWIRGKPPA